MNKQKLKMFIGCTHAVVYALSIVAFGGMLLGQSVQDQYVSIFFILGFIGSLVFFYGTCLTLDTVDKNEDK